MPEISKTRSLLAVDLGLMTGLALFGGDGTLRWYRSQHFANSSALRKAVHRLLRDIDDLASICIEGGGNLGDIWKREADKRGVPITRIAAETWRERLLYARDQRNGKQAKRRADYLARQVIEWSHAPRPTSLRHDASEAILIGLWGVLNAGWIDDVPPELRCQIPRRG